MGTNVRRGPRFDREGTTTGNKVGCRGSDETLLQAAQRPESALLDIGMMTQRGHGLHVPDATWTSGG